MHDVAAALGDEPGDGGDDPGPIRARQEEDTALGGGVV
jgi:hypothetical protein